jgi:hypothetical protein
MTDWWSPTKVQKLVENFYTRTKDNDYLGLLVQGDTFLWKSYVTEMKPKLECQIREDYSTRPESKQKPNTIINNQEVKIDLHQETKPISPKNQKVQSIEKPIEFYFDLEVMCMINHRNTMTVTLSMFNKDEPIEDKMRRVASVLLCELTRKELEERHTQYDEQQLHAQTREYLKQSTKELVYFKEKLKNAKINSKIIAMPDERYCERCLHSYHIAETHQRELDKLRIKNEMLIDQIQKCKEMFSAQYYENQGKLKNVPDQPEGQKTTTDLEVNEDNYLSQIHELTEKSRIRDEQICKLNQKCKKLQRRLKLKGIMLRHCQSSENANQETTSHSSGQEETLNIVQEEPVIESPTKKAKYIEILSDDSDP